MHRIRPRTPSEITVPSSVPTNPSASNMTYRGSLLEKRIVAVFRIYISAIAAEDDALERMWKKFDRPPEGP